MALIASYFLARRVVHPMRVLRQGVERIGTGDLSYRLDLKTGDEIEVLADEFNRMTSQLQESYVNLEQKVEDRTRELTESLEQQTATSEILGVIASSPTDIQPVLDAVAERAARLCDADDAQLFLVEGEHLQRVAGYGAIPFVETVPSISRATPAGRAVIDRQTIHVADLAAELDNEFPDSKERQQVSGARTILTTPLLREGIAALVQHQDDMVVAGEACDGAEALEQFRRLRPDVVLMDLQMPGCDGIAAIAAIRAEAAQARIIVLTTYRGDAQALRALKAGASGYLLKTSLRRELLDTIRCVHAGRRRVLGEVAADIAEHAAGSALSVRETEVLRCAADGAANKQIALQLGVTEETVKVHMKNILEKLGANDRTHAVTIAVRRGIFAL